MGKKAAFYLTPIVFSILLVAIIMQFQKKEKVEEEDYTKRKGYEEFSLVDDRFIKEQSFTGNNKYAKEVAATIKEKALNLIKSDSYWRKMEANELNTYCQFTANGDSKFLVVLLYIPGINDYSKSEQNKFSSSLWYSLQLDADKLFDGFPTICLGLRDKKSYGLISVGGKNHPPSKEIGGDPFYQAYNKEHIFYPYFKEVKADVQVENLKAKHDTKL